MKFKNAILNDKEIKAEEAYEHSRTCPECILFKEKYASLIQVLRTDNNYFLGIYNSIKTKLPVQNHKISISIL